MEKNVMAMFVFAIALTGCGGAAVTPADEVDTTPPTVISVSPANGATNVGIDQAITVIFSETVDCATLNATTFTVKDASNAAVSWIPSCLGTIITFSPLSNYTANATYTADFTTGVKDSEGNALTSAFTWSFATGSTAAEKTPPLILSQKPINNATGVSTSTIVTATFSEAMDSSSITTTTFTLKDGANNAIAGAVAYDSTSLTATFTPSAALSYNTTFTATITSGVKDTAGNAMGSANIWSFTTGGQKSVIKITSSISTSTTWTSDKVYVIVNFITINTAATLTIEPGTVIKFKSGAEINVNGKIIANATSTSPIVFTSIKDDTWGGDTNGDGSASSPAAIDWEKIAVSANGSVFKNVHFYYGGGGSATGGSTLDLNTYSATVANSQFAHNHGGGLISPVGALDAVRAGSNTVITGNTFYDNVIPLSISKNFSLDASNTFQNPDNASQKNRINGVFVKGYLANISEAVTWSETEVPFVIADSFAVLANASLTLSENVVLKFMSGTDITVNGVMNATGTATGPIVFTSIKDDTWGGDTNGDGNLTFPAVKDWDKVELYANGSVFNHVRFYYGGGGSATAGSTLYLNTYSATVTNSLFAHNHGGALSLPFGALNAGKAGSNTVITGNTFYDNVIPLTISKNFSLDASNTFQNPDNASQKNSFNGVFVGRAFSSNNISEAVTWSETEVPFVIVDSFSILANASLTLSENVVLKFMSSTSIQVSGTLVGWSRAGVKLTSFKDDTVIGDTNGDGNSTSPLDNDWNGIYFDSSNQSLYPPTNNSGYALWPNVIFDSH